jgi:hypothetical protein
LGDRGPNTKGLIDWLIALKAQREAEVGTGGTHFIAGNHDFAMAAFIGSSALPVGVQDGSTPASTQYTTSSSCGSGVDDDGQCDDGEFKLDTVSVVSEAAVERKEVRRVRPLLSELQVPEWQELDQRISGSGEIC